MLSSSLVSNLTRSLASQLNLQPAPTISLAVCKLLHTSPTDFSSRHGGLYKKDYRTLRERPLGPHRKLAPGVKVDDRVGERENYRFKVHYPEDGKYTIKKLPITKLGGRCQITGRKIIGRVGGGSKWKFRWIDWKRLPDDWPRSGEPLVEKVLSINYDPVRKPMIALTGYDDKLRWQIATVGMKEGDLITTSFEIPEIPIKPENGNSYPLGALPIGTTICLLQKFPDAKSNDDIFFKNANECGTIVRKIGDRVIIENDRRFQYSLDKKCQCVVGQVSIHPLKALPIGSPNRMRWLGKRPRSGLWHRKTGQAGRKIKALPPVQPIDKPEPVLDKKIILHCNSEGTSGRVRERKKPWLLDLW